jgi:hypothetical protein
MEGNKIKLKYIKEKGWDFIFEEVESGEEVVLKVFKNKPFIGSFKEGQIGMAIVNQNWVNSWEPLDAEGDTTEKVATIDVTETKPQKPRLTPYDVKNIGAKIGGAMHDAAALAVADNDTSMTNLDKHMKVVLGLMDKYTATEEMKVSKS